MADRSSAPGYRTVFRATGLSPLHMLQWVALGFAVAGLGLAWHLSQAPEQALTAPATKSGWSGFLALTALAAPVAAFLYGRRLVARVEISEDGQRVRVRDSNLLGAGWREFPRTRLIMGSTTAGDPAGEQAVAPPRLEIAIEGGGRLVVPLGRQKGAREALTRALAGTPPPA